MTKITDIPAIRFKGFSDTWEQRKVREVTDRYDNLRIPVAASLRVAGTTPYYGANGIQDYVDGYTHDGEFILVAEDGANDLKNYPVKCVKGRIWVNNHAHVLQGKYDCADNQFLAYAISQADIESLLVGGGRAKLNAETLMGIDLLLPNKAEQIRIGKYLAQLDNLITLHQRKYDKLTNVKKSMLEKMFPQNGSNAPEIRFKGFTEAWEQRKAIDIADYSKGNGYSKGDLTDAGTPIILYGRLYTKYQFAISEVDTFTVPRNGAVYSQGNEVIVPASGETADDIARASAVEKSGVLLGGDLNILRPFDFINPLFLALAISNGEPQKELAKKAQGKSVVHIHNTDIQEVTIAYPSRTEQDRIVSVFRQLDHLITLHQCKCQIDGCRFQSPLAITWEQRKLGEIGSVSMCRRIFKEQTSENGEIPFYKIGTFGGEADAFISRELFEEYKAKYQYPKKGDILISASGSIGRTVAFTGKNEYFQDSNIVWLNHDKHLDNSFLKCFYSIVKWAGIEGSTIKRLYNDNILNTAITLPSVEEQQKIGAYFENLDNLITLHQRKPVVVNSSSTMNALPNQHLYFQVLE